MCVTFTADLRGAAVANVQMRTLKISSEEKFFCGQQLDVESDWSVSVTPKRWEKSVQKKRPPCRQYRKGSGLRFPHRNADT